MANGNQESTTDLSRYRVPILDRALVTRLSDSQLDDVGWLTRTHADIISTWLGCIQPPPTA